MSKLILSLENKKIKEITIDKDVMTIGRRPDSDIPIDDLASSGRHSKLVTLLNDSFIEDLGSTNGTYVNGELVKKHALNNNDVITIGKHVFKYIYQDEKTDLTKTMSMEIKGEPTLQILSGDNSGSHIKLTKRLTTIGDPGVQVGAITHRSNGYYFLNIDSDSKEMPPLINGSPINDKAQPLKNHDVIELAGVKMEFVTI